MTRRDVEADIMARLDAFLAGGGKLPATTDQKVNVSALCRDLGLAPSDAQYFHKRDAIKATVNALAEDQGLAPIGARAQSEEDKAVQSRIARVASQAKSDAQAAAEQAAAASAILAELRAAQAENKRLRLENDSLKARLQIIEEGGVPPRL